MTNSKSRDVTLRFLSKKIPPRNGLKNLSMMASEKPSACMATNTTDLRYQGFDHKVYEQDGHAIARPSAAVVIAYTSIEGNPWTCAEGFSLGCVTP